MKAQFEADMLNVNRDLEKLRREKVMWEMTKQTGDQRGAASTCDEQVGVKKLIVMLNIVCLPTPQFCLHFLISSKLIKQT